MKLPAPSLTATIGPLGAVLVHRQPGQPDEREEKLLAPTCRLQRRAADSAARFLAMYQRPRRTVPKPRRQSAPSPRPQPDPASFLTEHEIEQIVLAVGHGMGTFTDDDCLRAVRWAEHVRVAAAILDLVLAGDLVIVVPPGNGEPRFVYPSTGAQP